MQDSKLFIIATPLGNRQDITLRALALFRELTHLFAEDTRELAGLLRLHGIPLAGKNLFSYSSHNLKTATEKALQIIKSGQSIGLVSDRGTPCISDPGYLLVQKAHAFGIPVIPIPGPSSVTTALSISGMPVDRFIFLGFLPPQPSKRLQLLRESFELKIPVCLFESPKRIRTTVRELKGLVRGELFMAREISKVHEEYRQASLEDISPEMLVEKGEYTLVVKAEPMKEKVDWVEEVQHRLGSDRDWSKAMAQKYSLPASHFYNALQSQKKHRE